MERSTEKEGRRFHELDALRGLAAMSVVLLHFHDMYLPDEWASRRSAAVDWGCTLLTPLYRGREAVVLFFLLSGFVLALPYLRGRAQRYGTYALRRIVRIYGPYLVALALSVGGSAIWHGHLGRGTWADRSWRAAPDVRSVAEHVLFVGSYNWHRYNMAFWSLIVELRVSLVFPLLVGVVLRLRAGWAAAVALGCLVVSKAATRLVPATEDSTFTVGYVSVFIAGILLARHHEAVTAWLAARTRAVRLMLGAVAALGYFGGHRLAHGSQSAIFVGALGAMVFALQPGGFATALRWRVPGFLGRISYSLYLVHLPVLFALTFGLGRRVGLLPLFALYLAAALGLATLFHRMVEAPLIEVSRRLSIGRVDARRSLQPATFL